MALIKGGFLRLFQTFLYLLAFLCAAVILGIYSYFLAVLTDRNLLIANWIKAVEGISGAAVLYTIAAVVLTCCLGGIKIFALIAIFLDILFAGAFIAIAVLTRDGASKCTGIVNTPIGFGSANSDSDGFGGDFGLGDNDTATYQVSPRTACKLNTAVFAVSIIGVLVFITTAAMQVLLSRHHKKEKRYGPGPSNGYTSGSGNRKFWQRKPKTTTVVATGPKRKFWQRKPNTTRDAEMGGAPVGLAAPVHHDNRTSYETSTTLGNNGGLAHDKVEHGTHVPANGAHTGYYTQPTGTGANPYGYERTTGTATNY